MRTKKIFLNMICDILPYLIIGVIGIVKMDVLINYIGDVGNGYYQTINQIISYVFLAQMGFSEAVTYSLYKPFADKNKDNINAIYGGARKVFRIIAFVILGIICLVTLGLYLFYHFEEGYKASALICFFIISTSYLISYFGRGQTYQAVLCAAQEKYVYSLVFNGVKILCDILIVVVTVKFRTLESIAIVILIMKILEEIINRIVVKGNAQKFRVRKSGEKKDQRIEHDQQPAQPQARENAQHAHREEEAHAHAHGDQKHGGVDVRHGLGENLQIRFRHGYGKPQKKARGQNQRQIPRPRQAGAGFAADGRHGDLRAEGEKAHAYNDQQAADQKAQQKIRLQRDEGQAQKRHDHDDRQSRAQGFLKLFDDCGPGFSEKGAVQIPIPPFCAGRGIIRPLLPRPKGYPSGEKGSSAEIISF